MAPSLAPPGSLAPEPVVDRSLRHSLWDGVCFSAMIGSAESHSPGQG